MTTIAQNYQQGTSNCLTDVVQALATRFNFDTVEALRFINGGNTVNFTQKKAASLSGAARKRKAVKAKRTKKSAAEKEAAKAAKLAKKEEAKAAKLAEKADEAERKAAAQSILAAVAAEEDSAELEAEDTDGAAASPAIAAMSPPAAPLTSGKSIADQIADLQLEDDSDDEDSDIDELSLSD